MINLRLGPVAPPETRLLPELNGFCPCCFGPQVPPPAAEPACDAPDWATPPPPLEPAGATQTSKDKAGDAAGVPAPAASDPPPDPQENGTNSPSGSIGRTGFSQGVDGVLSGFRWTGGTITYSAPDSPADYGPYPFVDTNNNGVSAIFEGLFQLSAAQLRVVHATLNTTVITQPAAHAGFSVEGFTNLNFNYVAGGSGNATIRYANTRDAATAYAFYPRNDLIGGDGFLGPTAGGFGVQPIAGNFEYATIVHELGHSLGLKHGHMTDTFGAIPFAFDSYEYSLMTYRSYVGAAFNGGVQTEQWGNPQTFMMFDIRALQHMYGADFSTNSGNTVYSWAPNSGQTLVNGQAAVSPGANRIFLTIWDGGGTDAYDLSRYASNLTIDLNPGSHSIFSTAQLADLNRFSAGGLARGNVFNALQFNNDPRSLIENAFGGSGNDFILGNAANNSLFGNLGADTVIGGLGNDLLQGLDGSDTLRGQAGNDTLQGGTQIDVLSGGQGFDIFDFNSTDSSSPAARDVVRALDGGPAFDAPGAGAGDRIDLFDIDANASLAGNQAFVFGTAMGIGRLWAVNVGALTYIRGNVNSSAAPEIEIAIEDGTVVASAYSAADFIL